MRHLAWTTLLTLLVSCEGTDIGNPIADVDFALYDAPQGVTVNTAWVAVHRLSLFPVGDCMGAATVEVPGLLAVDLLGGQRPQALNDLPIDGDYCRVEVMWDAGADPLPAGAPPELVGATIVIKGTRADGTPFVLRSRRTDALQLGGGGAFTIPAGTTGLFVAFDAPALFTGVDLSTATVGGDGVIHIETGSNDAHLTAFETALHGGAHLFHDADHDGAFDPEEHMPGHSIVDGH